MSSIPRPEHPKPQMERERWQNLNGPWDFEFDPGRSGKERGMNDANACFSRKINVPFCPESVLSGINDRDFHSGLWYRRKFTVGDQDLLGRVFLHFGAVDYRTEVFINGESAGSHTGGYVSFRLEIEQFLNPGENTLTVYAEDDTRDPLIPRGKQSEEYYSHNCDYTRTSGIWQTVWLEFTPKEYVDSIKIFPSVETSSVTLILNTVGAADLSVLASFDGKPMGSAGCKSKGGSVSLSIPLCEPHLWEVGKGGLYNLRINYGNDSVKSYFGLRSVSLDGKVCRINGEPVFQRLVLDQGFYPEGIYTAPDDGELCGDILRSMAMGFNGARLHQKIFEERFLYHADRLGYIVWGEYPNWGLDHTRPEAIYGILPEWLQEVSRDFNHPSIVGWCPFNETWDQHGNRQFDPMLSLVYRATKAADPTRPCIDTSGNFHVETDIFDLHDYEQDAIAFSAHYNSQDGFFDRFADRQKYGGQPLMVSEYGGIGFSIGGDAWSYGSAAKSKEEYIERFASLADAMLDNPDIMGFCYTQLTDIEQEQNGVYTYDRIPKVEPEIIRRILSRKAAVEKEGEE